MRIKTTNQPDPDFVQIANAVIQHNENMSKNRYPILKTVYPDKTFSSHEEWRAAVLKMGEPAEGLISTMQAIAAHMRTIDRPAVADMLQNAIATYRAKVELLKPE